MSQTRIIHLYLNFGVNNIKLLAPVLSCLSCFNCRTLMVDLIVSSRSSVQTPEHILQPGGVALRDFVSPLRMHKRKSEAVEFNSKVASEAVKSRASADDLAKTRSFVITVECASVSQLTENIRGSTLFQVFYDLEEQMTRLEAAQTRRSEARREECAQLTETLT